mgnify:CR=1 FL=1
MKISARSIPGIIAALAIAACSPEPAAVSEDGGADLILIETVFDTPAMWYGGTLTRLAASSSALANSTVVIT